MDEGGGCNEAIVQFKRLTPDRSLVVSGLFGNFPGYVENLEIIDQRPRLFLFAGSDAREDLRYRDRGTEDPRPIQQRREKILRPPAPAQEMDQDVRVDEGVLCHYFPDRVDRRIRRI